MFFFCGETGDVHDVTTFALDSRVRNCACLLQNSRLLAKLGGGDMIAMEAKYHSTCLVSLYNRARDACMHDNVSDKPADVCCDSLAFTQLVEYIDEVQSHSQHAPVFKLSDLAMKYKSRLEQMGVISETRVNTVRTGLDRQVIPDEP